MIKCCMFDLDGTLLNTLSTITYYVNQTLQKYDISPISEGECKYFVGSGARALIHRTLASRGEYSHDFECEVYDSYIALYDKDPYYLTRPYEGIRELIEELTRRGVVCAVISNKQSSATKAAISHFFPEKFALVRGGVDGVPLKPDPTSPRAMLDELGISEADALYIGDTGVDMLTGKGMNAAITVGVKWGFREEKELVRDGADIVISRPDEILSLIDAS